jgi:phosphate butyryltransferase
MDPIRSLDQLLTTLAGEPPRRLAIAAGQDEHSLQAAAAAATRGIAKVILCGHRGRIMALCEQFGIARELFDVRDELDPLVAARMARDLVRAGEADVLMKGIISTDQYMHLVLDKERGLLPKGNVLTHLAVADIPGYQQLHGKLLFLTDVAIIPAPDVATKVKLARYAIQAAHSFGIAEPRVALLAASEKVTDKMPATVEAAIIAKMADRGQLGKAIVDGPLAIDVALSPEACAIKGLCSPVGGAADVLLFPNIESGNMFYKAVTMFGGARMASALVGTSAPCVLTSRADSEETKLFSIALGCCLARGL